MNKFNIVFENIMEELNSNNNDLKVASDKAVTPEKLDELVSKYIDNPNISYQEIKILETISENPNLSYDGFDKLSDKLSDSSIIFHLLKNPNIPRDIIFKLIDKKSALNDNNDLQYAILHKFENDEEIVGKLKEKGIELINV